MHTTMFIGSIVGPCMLIVGLSLLCRRDFFLDVMDSFTRNAALIFIAAVFTLAFSIAIVRVHNRWAFGWPLVITLFGWGGIIKGVWLLLFPQTIEPFMALYRRNRQFMTIHAGAATILGIAITLMSYR